MKRTALDPFCPDTRPRRRDPVDQIPAAPTPEEIEAAAALLADWKTHSSLRAVARALGIRRFTLAFWMEEHPRLQQAWEKLQAMQTVLRRQQKPPQLDEHGRRVPPLALRVRLAGYFLIHRVELHEKLTEDHEKWAATLADVPWDDWKEACRRSPKKMAGIRRKRALLARAGR